MSLRKRTLLTASLLVLGLTAGALVMAGLRLENAQRSRAEQDLQATTAAARQLGADRIQRLAIETEVLATLLPATGALAGDRASDALHGLVTAIGGNRQLPGLIVVCDVDLRCATAAQALSTEEILQSGATEGSGLRPRQGLLAIGNRFFEFASRPITGPRGQRLGFVLAGEEVEPAIAQSLGRQTGAEVVLVAGGQSIGSTLPLGTAAEAVDRPDLLAEDGPIETVLREREYLAQFISLDELMPQWGGSQPGAGVLMLVPLDQTPVWGHPLMRDILLLGLGTLAVALALLWLVGSPLDRSLTRLTEAISRGAATGRLQEEFTGYADLRGTSETDGLRDALRSLMNKFELIQRDREKSYVEAIGAVVAAIDARDHETIGHSFRVAHYACALARVIGIEGEDLRLIEWGALLHDVGKIAVPDAILRKQGSLTDQEWEVMRQHPNWGFEMLADVEFLRPALDIVYSHHERWDGSGYPQGRKGKEIPLAARIFAVVDTYDAITSDRPYRRAKTYSDAVAELVRVSGEQLDPEMVEAFIRIPEAELRRLRELSEQLDLGERIPQALTNQIELQRV